MKRRRAEKKIKQNLEAAFKPPPFGNTDHHSRVAGEILFLQTAAAEGTNVWEPLNLSVSMGRGRNGREREKIKAVEENLQS